MKKKYLTRTRLGNELACEVAFPERQTGKVALVCPGAPGSPVNPKVLEHLADNGYVAFGVRYRGTWESTGTFLKDSPTKDVLDIIDYLVKHKSITDAWSKEKILVKVKHFDLFGGSFGGPAVLLASKNKYVRKVVAMTPVIDFNKDGEGETFEQFVDFATVAFGGVYRPGSASAWQKLRRLDFYNPITMHDKIDEKKCFVIQTVDDDVCLADNLRNLVALKKIVVYYKPKGGHLGTYKITHKFYWNKINKFLQSR